MVTGRKKRIKGNRRKVCDCGVVGFVLFGVGGVVWILSCWNTLLAPRLLF